MDKTMRIVDVGEPEAGKKTSPIEAAGTGEQVCWFNDREFGQDDMVFSGNDILRCESGAWVRSGTRQG